MTTDIQVTKDESGQILIHGVREVAERIVSDMSRSGFPVDEEYLVRLEAHLREQIYQKLRRVEAATKLARNLEVHLQPSLEVMAGYLERMAGDPSLNATHG
jgi:hypothetical protein